MANEEEEIKAHEGRDPGTGSASGDNSGGNENMDKRGLLARIRHDRRIGFWILAVALILGFIFF
jgi:hypothetical protein